MDMNCEFINFFLWPYKVSDPKMNKLRRLRGDLMLETAWRDMAYKSEEDWPPRPRLSITALMMR